MQIMLNDFDVNEKKNDREDREVFSNDKPDDGGIRITRFLQIEILNRHCILRAHLQEGGKLHVHAFRGIQRQRRRHDNARRRRCCLPRNQRARKERGDRK